jgi:hypothetical protein
MPNLHNTSAFSKTIRHHNGARGEADCAPQRTDVTPSGVAPDSSIDASKKA